MSTHDYPAKWNHPGVLEGLAIEMMRDMLITVKENGPKDLKRFEFRISVSAKWDADEVLLCDWAMDCFPPKS